MKFASLKYNNSVNLGDEFQTLAAEQFLPQVHRKLHRDQLGTVRSEDQYLLILNCWFSYQGRKSFPPSAAVVPVFFGFHIARDNNGVHRFLTDENIEYLKVHQPIGCRDRKTMEFLTERGIDAFYSKCLTLTFPRRSNEPRPGRVFIVDADHIPIPDFLHEQAVVLTQDTYPFLDDETKTRMAQKFLDMYSEEAKLVVTTRLHCALPCIAMGIPVLLFGDSENTRIALVKDLGLEIHPLPPRWLGRSYRVLRHSWLGRVLRYAMTKFYYHDVDWGPRALDIEAEKQRMIASIQSLLTLKSVDNRDADSDCSSDKN